MDTVRQTPARQPLTTASPSPIAVAPQQVWPLLTPNQQQIAMQTLIQISCELVRQARQEVCDEQPSA